jgi:hypothetical protein
LVAAGLAIVLFVGPHGMVDLHLISSVYLAGGPDSVNQWAQAQIQQQQPIGGSRQLNRDEIPPGVRSYLPGWTNVGGTLWSDQTQLRIERGGGFYHYGIVVYPTGTISSSAWWQQLLGWPPELVVYHED